MRYRARYQTVRGPHLWSAIVSRNNDYRGEQGVFSSASEFNAQSFLINQILNARNVSTLVQIKAVTNSGGLSPVGFVDVLPLVNQLDGDNNTVPHGVVHNLPYFRMQGGTDAVIMDPKIGDIGIAVFADRDISAVKASKAAASPGSKRRSSMADGMYIGGFLNGVPVQYVQFTESGINVVSPTKISCKAPTVEIETEVAKVDASTSATVTSPAISLGATGQTLLSFVTSAFQSLFNGHTHTSGGAGSPTSNPNQAMGDAHLTTTVKGG
jgi:hypothetical protein